ncbi:MAG: alpha/beta hydrolase [Aridibacter famidurans]|nr:alpha/beta hydrolase [Aridibacter famidurans]
MRIRPTFQVFLFVLALSLPASGQHTQAEIDDWYFQSEDGAARIYVREIGKGETFVVLHGGFGAEHSYLLKAVAGLENRFHFVFYDQRGSLLSPAKNEDISVAKHVDDLESLRKALDLEQLNLLGHSNGTRLAMLYLEKYPKRVGKIVMVGSLYPKGGARLSEEERSLRNGSYSAFAQFMKREAVSKAYGEFGMSGAEKPASERTRQESESMAQNWQKLTAKQRAQLDKISNAAANVYHVDRWRMMKAVKPHFNESAGNAAFKTVVQDYDFVKVLRAHPFPITVINGDHEQLDFGNKLWRHISPELPNVEIRVIEKAGHNIWIDQPARFQEELRKALSK